MGKIYKYKCTFSSVNILTGILGHFTVFEVATSLKEAKKALRLKGYHIGNDFVYQRLDL